MAESPFLSRINWVDVLAIILFIRMGYVGFQIGLSSELIKLAGVGCGFFVSFGYYQGLGDALAEKTFLSMEWAAALVMVSLVSAIYFGLTRLLRLGEKFVQLTFQSTLNQLGGLLVGIFRAGLVASVILVALRQLPSPALASSIEEHSLTGHAISRIAPTIYDVVNPGVARFAAVLHPQKSP